MDGGRRRAVLVASQPFEQRGIGLRARAKMDRVPFSLGQLRLPGRIGKGIVEPAELIYQALLPRGSAIPDLSLGEGIDFGRAFLRLAATTPRNRA